MPFAKGLNASNIDLPAEHIWRSFKDRSDAENRIIERKYYFGLDSFCRLNFGPLKRSLEAS